MNKHFYRVIFNKVRGLTMVVAENQSVSATQTTTRYSLTPAILYPVAKLGAINFAVLTLLGASMVVIPAARAQIVADTSAPPTQQPVIIHTANGLPQVNIQTPSAAGVSRNTYTQFDVQNQGAILNNSRTDVQTELGGWIQRNPHLVDGSARVILNEINSTNPSFLNGYVEVAGDRAQVIIANPSGITCDSCGFINASRSTLTTGLPVISGGNLEGYLVRQGMVTIKGAGLDDSRTDFTEIIARAVQVNTAIWSKDLKITVGANRVGADHSSIEKISETDVAPAFGVDVAHLGGMYANKIVLVGTDAGVGMRNAGSIGAAAGDVIITADGMLENQASRIQASGNIQIATATHEVNNTEGLIEAGSHLTVSAKTLVNADTKKSTQGLHGEAVTLNVGDLNNDKGSILAVDAIVVSGAGSVSNNAGVIQSNGSVSLDMATGIINDGLLQAADSLNLVSSHIDNQVNGSIVANTVDAKTAHLVNRGLIDGQNTWVDAGVLTNIGTGRMYGDHLAIRSDDVENAHEVIDGVDSAPVIAARNRLDIGAGIIRNREHALLFSAGDMAIGGVLDADYKATGMATELHNNSATIEAMSALDLKARHIENTNEHFSTHIVEISREWMQEYQYSGSATRYRADQVTIINDEADDMWVNGYKLGNDFNRYDFTRVITESQVKESDPAKIYAGGNLNITADTLLNDNSKIVAGGVLDGTIGKLTNTEVPGQHITTDFGTAYHFFNIERKGRDDQGISAQGYSPAPVIKAISLTPTVYKENTAIAGSNTQIATLGNTKMNNPIVISNNSLFLIHAKPGLDYLVQSDPRFTDYRNWLSSDYMLKKLDVDPTLVQKRLGDGFYEQKLVREQVVELTGKRFLEGYSSDEQQYRDLLDSGVTYAKQWNLAVGVALSAEQIAQLTADIVILVERDVVLADGSTVSALVPQLYAKVRDGDIDSVGGLLSADAVNLKIEGDINNGGTIAGRNLLTIDAYNINNIGGHFTAKNVVAHASNDINNLGGIFSAGDALVIDAGRDLNMTSTTQDSQTSQGSRTNIDRVAALYVANKDGNLMASAGQDININAAQIINAAEAGTTTIVAGNDITLGTVTETHRQEIVWDADNYRKESSAREVGSSIAVAGDIHLISGRNAEITGAEITSSKGVINVVAANDIDIKTATTIVTVDEGHQTVGSSGMFSTKTVTTLTQLDQSESNGSSLSGNTVNLQAGNDLNVTGSAVVSEAGTVLIAGNDIAITTAVDKTNTLNIRNEETSGLFSGGGIGFTIGTKEIDNKNRQIVERSVSSTVGSTAGDISILAGSAYSQLGSSVLTPGGDIDIVAKKVDIVAAIDNESSVQDVTFKQSGLTLQLTSPIISAVQTVQQLKEASEKTKDDRVKALAGAAAALNIANTAYDIKNAPDGSAPVGGINLAISLGASKNENHNEQRATFVRESKVAASGDVNIRAVGGAENSNLTVQGSDVIAGGNVTLRADNEISLLAAQNTTAQKSNNKGISGSIGVSIGTDGLMFNAGLSGSRGRGDGADVIHTNTYVDAGNRLTISSGTDTTLKGAVASGKEVLMDVGTSGQGDLNIASLQDTSTYQSSQQSLGASVSVGMGKVSGSLNAGRSSVDGNYASVIEQSGIVAGDGGFNIHVAGNTDLQGAKIASTEQAVLDGKNSLTTQTLTQSDIQNKSDYKAESQSLGIGGGFSGAKSALNGTGVSFGGASGSESSITKSGISEGDITINDALAQQEKSGLTVEQTLASINTNVSSDIDTSGSLTKGWDGQQLQEDVTAQAQITAAFGKEAAKGIGNYATSKLTDIYTQIEAAIASGNTELVQQLKSDAALWDEGGLYRTALHTAAGALSGGVGGALGAASSALAMQQIDQLVGEMDLPDAVRNALGQVAATALGAIVGGVEGAAAGVAVEANNRQLHEDARAREKTLAKKLAEDSGGRFTQEQIEQALMAAYNVDLGETPITGVDISKYSPEFFQNYRKKSNVLSEELISYIKESTGNTYKWLPLTTRSSEALRPKGPDYVTLFGGTFFTGINLTVNLHNGDIHPGMQLASSGFGISLGWINMNKTGDLADTDNTTKFLLGTSFEVNTCSFICVGKSWNLGGQSAALIGLGFGAKAFVNPGAGVGVGYTGELIGRKDVK